MSKSMLFLLLCLGVGLFQNWGRIGHWLNPRAPVGNGSENVVLYATQWCGYCAKTRKFFAENNIAYQELDVENSEEGRSGYARLGGGGVPIVVVNETSVIHGYDPAGILEALASSANGSE